MMQVLGLDTRLSAILRRLAAGRSGVAMFEFAITLPILLIIFAGGWELARGLWVYESLNKGVRDASRYLARVNDPTSPLSKTMALQLVLTGDSTPGQPARIDYNYVNVTVGTRTFDNSAGLYRSKNGETDPIDVVQVAAEMTYVAPLLSFMNIANPIVFRVAHEERHIGD